jgi:branched-chain amino acid transport system permease protein
MTTVPTRVALPKSVRYGSLFVVAVAFILFPVLFPSPAITTMGVFAMLYLLSVTGWNIFSGYTGYIALGHAMFFGIGQYTSALLQNHFNIPAGWDVFGLIPVAGLLAGLVAIPLGWLLLRVRKHTFIVLTIAVMFIFQLFAFNFRGFTGGSQGLQVKQPNWRGDSFNQPFYYVALFCASIALLVSWWIRRSKFGLGLLAIRDDEDRARSLGVKTDQSKLIAFAISAVFVGMAGAIYTPFQGAIFPQFAFDPAFDLALVVFAFAGGLGTIIGPALGAVVIGSAQQYFLLRFGGENIFLIIYGLFFVLILRFLPEGIVPSISRRWREWMATKDLAKTPETEDPPGAQSAPQVSAGSDGSAQ